LGVQEFPGEIPQIEHALSSEELVFGTGALAGHDIPHSPRGLPVFARRFGVAGYDL